MTINANLTYLQLLKKECYINFILPLRPNTIVPKFDISVLIQENQEISILKIPEIRKTITDTIN